MPALPVREIALLTESVVNAPVEGVEAPIAELLIDSPLTLDNVPPRDTGLDPMVMLLFVRLLLPMSESVLLLPLMVLLVSVSVVALPTKVSVEVGRVSAPVLLMLLIIGLVRVLLVRIWVSSSVTNVFDAGIDVPFSVVVLEAERVVNAPAAAAVPPMAGGEAKYVLKPVPETVDEAESVVNAPPAAVRFPIVMPLSVWVQEGSVPSVVST